MLIGRWAVDLLEAVRCDASIWDSKCVMPLCSARRRHNTGQCLSIAAALSRYPEYDMFGMERFQVPMECMDCKCLKRDEDKKCEHCKLECYCARRRFVVREESEEIAETVSSCTVQASTCAETVNEDGGDLTRTS